MAAPPKAIKVHLDGIVLKITREGSTWLVLMALFLLTAIFVWEIFIPKNLVISIFYSVPLLVAAISTRRRWLWAIGLTAITLSILAPIIGQPKTGNTPIEILGLRIWIWNRIITTASLIPQLLIADIAMNLYRQVLGQAEELSGSNDQLETANRDVATREEEITRQNEELQAQTEELERQSEELRITNDDLAQREKMLERLLDLSRSLTAETSNLTFSDVLSRLCEALMELAPSDASAIMVREGAVMKAVCHTGFGKAGLLRDSIPFEHTFASLIMARLQTGYIEDIAQRPDLEILQPAQGSHFTSVLACPLQIRGRFVGTVEVYTQARRVWSADQISLIESLGAQATVSLNASELFQTVQNEKGKFETAFRTMPFAVIVAEDPSFDHVRLNPAATQMFGLAHDGAKTPFAPDGSRQRSILFRDGRPVPEQDLPLVRAIRADEQVLLEEYDIIFSNNMRRTVLVSASPVHADGLINGAVLSCVDITPHKKLQLELETRRREAEEASVRKTRFLAAISHDIRTPVNAINLMAELISRSSAQPALAGEMPSLAQELQKNANALSMLVHDLLDVARFDSGKIEFQESEFSLGSLIAEECRHLLPLAQEKSLRLEYENHQTIWIRSDKVKLSRILANLLGNAIKFTNQGTVAVRARFNAEGQVILQISDTGVGISRDHIPRIFDEFTQLRNPERDRLKGTGLGLAISRRLVEAMGGTIAVQSVEGRGSTFTVTLPASLVIASAQTERERREAGDRREPTLTGLRVLLVEDHVTTRWATSQILLAEGAIVMEAPDGTRALALLETGDPEVVLLDMMLPDMDGTRVLEELRQKKPPRLKQILVLTGDATAERIDHVTRLGADGIVSKPIDVDALIGRLQSVAAQKEEG